MAIYATSSQFGGAAAPKKQQTAEEQARAYMQQQGQAAPQQGNYAGGSAASRDQTRAGAQPPPRTSILGAGAAAGPRTQGTGSKPVRTGQAMPGRPTVVPTQPGPRVQVQPQVRDRAFSQGEQAYRQGGAPMAVANLQAAPPNLTGVAVGGVSGPAAQPNLTGQLPTDWGTPAGQTGSVPKGMAFAGALPAYTPGTVQTRVDAQTPPTPPTPWDYVRDAYNQWNQNAQDNAAGNQENNATYTGARSGTGDGNENRAEDAAAQGDAALEAELRAMYPVLDESRWTLDDYNGTVVTPDVPGGGGGGGGDDSPLSDPARWLARLLGEPFGEATKVLNKYGKEAVADYYDNWSDLDPLRTTGKDLMDPTKLQQYEDAARARMQASIGNERDAAARQLLGQAGRGGAIGSGRETGINNAAMRAMMEGEQRLLEDSFRRKLASQQLGAGIYGDATRAKYGTMEDTYISPGELAGIVIPAAADMFGAGMEGLGGAMGDGPGPLPFLKLLFGG